VLVILIGAWRNEESQTKTDESCFKGLSASESGIKKKATPFACAKDDKFAKPMDIAQSPLFRGI
jgi:hypothetical protein